MVRVARLKIFIDSTVEGISKQFNIFFDDCCPGSILNTYLHMHGGVYQYEVLYTELIDRENVHAPT